MHSIYDKKQSEICPMERSQVCSSKPEIDLASWNIKGSKGRFNALQIEIERAVQCNKRAVASELGKCDNDF